MFIVFEGLDGSGSTTQARLLAEALLKRGIEVLQTKEPVDGTPIGNLIRSALKKEWKVDPKALQLLFTADRAQHLAETIQPAQESGKTVISDRYLLSTVAFGSLSVPRETLLEWNSSFPRPDLTFLFRLDPKECIARIESRGNTKELFEKEETLRKVWETYEWLVERFPEIVIIDASQSIEQIHAQCLEKVLEKR